MRIGRDDALGVAASGTLAASSPLEIIDQDKPTRIQRGEQQTSPAERRL